jgi:hypothetical protein
MNELRNLLDNTNRKKTGALPPHQVHLPLMIRLQCPNLVKFKQADKGAWEMILLWRKGQEIEWVVSPSSWSLQEILQINFSKGAGFYECVLQGVRSKGMKKMVIFLITQGN